MDFLKASLDSLNTIRQSILERRRSFQQHTDAQLAQSQAAEQAITRLREQLQTRQAAYLAQLQGKVIGYLADLDQSIVALYKALGLNAPVYTASPLPTDGMQRFMQLKELLASISKQVQGLNASPANRFFPTVQVSYASGSDTAFDVAIDGRTSRYTLDTPRLSLLSLTGKAGEMDSLLRKLYNDVVQAYTLADVFIRNVGEDDRFFPSMARFEQIAAAYRNEGQRGGAERQETAIRERFRQPFYEQDEKLLNDIAAYAAAHPPTGGAFASDAGDVLRLGDITVQVCSAEEAAVLPQDAVVVRRAPAMQVELPLTWDLRTLGGVVLDASEGGITEAVRQAVDRFIAHMLLHFPPGRLNLCLIDPNDLCNFARFARLAQANATLLCDGIVRSEGRVADTLANMLSLVHRTKDRLYMGERTDDFFTYNQKAIGNPLAATLVVCVGFPGMLRGSAINDVLQLLRAGVQAGVYTLLVCDGQTFQEPSMRDTSLSAWLTQLQENALLFRVHGESLLMGMTPLPNLCRLAPAPNIGRCVQMLETGFGQARNKSVPLSEAFSASDRLAQRNIPASQLLEIPVGVSGNQIVSLLLDTTGRGNPYAIAIGSPGMGKSSLLHTIILSACYRYSPEELQLYLVDFKGGVEFKYYEANGDKRLQLPHIQLIGLSSDPMDGIAILENLYEQMLMRERTFNEVVAADLHAYNSIRKDRPLPRLLMIVDEVQELLQGNDRITSQAVELLHKILATGRGPGIGVMLVTQNLPSTPGLQKDVVGNIGNRISLRLNNPDNAEAIGIESRLVRQLDPTLTGCGIIRVGGVSQEFRAAFAGAGEERDGYRERVLQRWAGASTPRLYVIGQSGMPDPIVPGSLYGYALHRGMSRLRFAGTVNISLGINYVSGKQVPLWLNFIQANANLWISGTDAGLTRDILSYAVLSVLLGTWRGSRPLYFANPGYRDETEPDDLIFLIPKALPERVLDITSPQRFRDTVVELFRLRRARAGEMGGDGALPEPVFLCVNNLQRYEELFAGTELISPEMKAAAQPPAPGGAPAFADLFGAGDLFADGGKASGSRRESLTFAAVFSELLKRGPDVGIHTLFTLSTPSALPMIRGFQDSVACKVLTHGGIDASMDYTRGFTLNRDDMALLFIADKGQKLIPYRYLPQRDGQWCGQLLRTLQEESHG